MAHFFNLAQLLFDCAEMLRTGGVFGDGVEDCLVVVKEISVQLELQSLAVEQLELLDLHVFAVFFDCFIDLVAADVFDEVVDVIAEAKCQQSKHCKRSVLLVDRRGYVRDEVIDELDK